MSAPALMRCTVVITRGGIRCTRRAYKKTIIITVTIIMIIVVVIIIIIIIIRTVACETVHENMTS